MGVVKVPDSPHIATLQRRLCPVLRSSTGQHQTDFTINLVDRVRQRWSDHSSQQLRASSQIVPTSTSLDLVVIEQGTTNLQLLRATADKLACFRVIPANVLLQPGWCLEPPERTQRASMYSAFHCPCTPLDLLPKLREQRITNSDHDFVLLFVHYIAFIFGTRIRTYTFAIPPAARRHLRANSAE